MKKRFINFNHDASHAGGSTEEDESIKSINQFADRIEEFKQLLGEKADASKFETVSGEITSLKAKIDELSSAQVVEALKSINDKATDIYKDVLSVLSDIADSRKEAPANQSNFNALVNEDEVKAFVNDLFDAAGKKKSYRTDKKITIKAPETFGGSVTFVAGSDPTAFTGRYIDPRLYSAKRKKNFILDNLNIPPINVPALMYLEKVEIGDTNTVSGDPGKADWILPGATKPKRSFRVKSAQAEAKKVAIFGTIEDKLLRDVPSFRNWIREDYTEEMRKAINDGLLNNNPLVNALAPLGLKTNAVQYVATDAFDEQIVDPNEIDCIVAAIAFQRNKKEEPALVAVSSDVFFKIQILKDNNARYQNKEKVYVDTFGSLFIAGVRVVDADEEDIPSENLLVLSADLGFKVFAYGSMVFEQGMNGNDFREDKTSFRAYQEFLSYIPSDRLNSVVYDTFANIKAAITKPDSGS